MTPRKSNRKRVCVCTSNRADREPRAPRHAVAIAKSGLDVEVVFLDCSPAGESECRLTELNDVSNLSRITHYYSHRNNGVLRLVANRAWQRFARGLFRAFNFALGDALSSYMIGVEAKLSSLRADVYIAHDIHMLVPAARAAKKNGAALVFDCMEFYSDMGGSQTRTDRRIIEALEAKWLPRCELILASSDFVADEYERKYEIPRPLTVLNCPKMLDELPRATPRDFRLYWRNSVIGLGQRGLDDAFVALSHLPIDISLHLQGRLPDRSSAAIGDRVNRLGIADRVFVHPACLPEEAVLAASEFTVGLCLERAGIRNQELTVSNKIFDYMMGGLPVVSSDLQGLADIVERSKGGMLYRSGDPLDLAAKIHELYSDVTLRAGLARNARRFALAQGNRACQMDVFLGAVEAIPCLQERPTVAETPPGFVIKSA